MKAPSVSQMYAMIRFLKNRAAEGDGARIEQLETAIAAERSKQAALDVDKFFGASSALAPAKPKK